MEVERLSAERREGARPGAIILALAAMGLYGMTGQIILVRELLVVFYGNELSLGLIFACWLLWVSIGAAVASARVPRLRDPARLLAIALTVAFVALPLETALIRGLRGILGTPPGLLIPLGQFTLATVLVLMPLSFLIGFTFPLAARVYSPQASGAAPKIGSLYVAETAGSVVGATVFTLLLAGRVSHFQAEAFMSLPLLASAIFLSRHLPPDSSRAGPTLAAVLAACAGVVLVAGGSARLERKAVEARWRYSQPGMELVEWRDSRYQHLAVARLADQITLYGNGSPIFSLPDEYEATLSAHLLLAQHPAPRRVLLVGGGTPEIVEEVLKHPVDRLDLVELDPELIQLTRAFSQEPRARVLDDPRVRIHAQDGRAFLKGASSLFDLVIVRLPDPSTAMLNRFYTVEFFREVAERLSRDGVFAFDLGGAVNYVGEEIGQFRGTVFASLSNVFPHLLVTPGDRNFFIAARAPGVISQDPEVLATRYTARGIRSAHFSPHLYPILLPAERMAWLRNALEEVESTDLNSDWHPVSYFHNVLLWDKFSGSGIGPVLRVVARIRLWMLVVALAGFILVRLLHLRLRPPASRSWGVFSALSTISTTGWLAMGIQLVILFSFQNQLGYVYEKVGLVVATFMLGLFAGGRLGSQWSARAVSPLVVLVAVEAAIVAFCLVLPRLLTAPGALGPLPNRVTEVWFFILSGTSGLMAGIQFPVASRLYLEHRADTSRAAGQVDWADHLGACLGAVLAGSLLIPVLGLTNTCLLLAGVKAANLVLLGHYGISSIDTISSPGRIASTISWPSRT